MAKTRKKKNYNNGNGMLTSIWGPSLWHFLHAVSFNYPVHPTKKQKQHYKQLLCNLQYVLPCGKCRKNLKQNFKKLPPKKSVFKNRHTFSKYIYNLHELINKMLNKKSRLSYKTVRNRYEKFRARCGQKTQKIQEKGCSESLRGKKTKCILKIVPHNTKCNTFQILN